MWDATGKLDNLDTPRNLAHRVINRLAMLRRDQRRQFPDIVENQLTKVEHHLRAFCRRCRRPARQGLLGHRDDPFNLGSASQRHLVNDRARRRIENILHAAAGALDFRATDIMC